MIVILSTTDFEYSTDEITQWLLFYNANFVRINGEDISENSFKISENIRSNNFLLTKLEENEKLIIFNRRWNQYNDLNNSLYDRDSLDIYLKHSLIQMLKFEISTVSSFIYRTLEKSNCFWIDHPGKAKINKLDVLFLAKEIGLLIPETLITSKKQELITFRNSFNRIITKTIGDLIPLQSEDYMLKLGTKEVTMNMIKKLPESFFLSCFQKLIQKQFDIRTFYWFGNFYSMAIFSQRRKESQIDFRNYDYNNPDRMVPYQLPQSIETKICQLMKILDLKTGSIDLIYSIDNEYVFLEINPIGQFGMVSKPCNYQLEKIIADKLIELDNEK